jgi:hypothetical protein
MVAVAQWQSVALWMQMLWVRAPSATPFFSYQSGYSDVKEQSYVYDRDITAIQRLWVCQSNR